MSHPSNPLATTRRAGTVTDISNLPTYIMVDIGADGVTNPNPVPCGCLSDYAPAVGDTAILLGVPGDYVAVGCLNATLNAFFSRYKFTKTANGVASGGFSDVGTPDTTPWSTGSAASNISTITMTKDAFLSVYCNTTGSFALLTVVYGNSQAAVSAQTQGGGVFNQAWAFSALMLAGETITIGARNTSAGLDNMVARTVMTFCDARWLVAEL